MEEKFDWIENGWLMGNMNMPNMPMNMPNMPMQQQHLTSCRAQTEQRRRTPRCARHWRRITSKRNGDI